MEPCGIIYCYKNKVNGKCYIGQTINEAKRKRDHKTAALRSEVKGSVFHSAIRKYGYNSFEYTILHSGKTKEELNVLEQIEIEKYNTLSPFGYNLKTGGKQRTKLSKQSYDKNKESCIRRWSNKEEHDKHIKNMNRPEVKARISESLKNSKAFHESFALSAEKRKKGYIERRIKNAPIKAKNDRIKEILVMLSRNERSRYRNTDEYKAIKKEQRKESVRNKKTVGFCIPVFCETNKKYYISATVAAKELGLNQVLVSRVIRGKNSSTRGYYFRKATEQESKEIKARYSCS